MSKCTFCILMLACFPFVLFLFVSVCWNILFHAQEQVLSTVGLEFPHTKSFSISGCLHYVFVWGIRLYAQHILISLIIYTCNKIDILIFLWVYFHFIFQNIVTSRWKGSKSTQKCTNWGGQWFLSYSDWKAFFATDLLKRNRVLYLLSI